MGLLLGHLARFLGPQPDRQVWAKIGLLSIYGWVVLYVLFWTFVGAGFMSAWFWTELGMGNLGTLEWLFMMLLALAVGVAIPTFLNYLPISICYRIIRGTKTPFRHVLRRAGLHALLSSTGAVGLGVIFGFCWH